MRLPTALISAILAIAACSDMVGPGPDVELEVTLSTDVAAPGENVTILITVHNQNPHVVSLGSRCTPLGFRVIDDSDHRVGPAFNYEGTFACIGEIENTIPAQGSKTFAGEPLRPPFSNRATIRVGAD